MVNTPARRIAVTATATAAALTLAACSGSGSDGTTEAATGPVEISYLHRLPDGEGMTAVNDIVARWNEDHPDIHVTATKFSGASPEMTTKLETDINADAGPCLAQIGYSELPDMYVKGLVQDVTAYASQYQANFSAGAYNQMGVGGKQLGLPQDVGPLVYYYNAQVFSQLGLEVPTNLDEFEATAATAAAAGKYISAFTPDEAQNWLAGQAAAAGDAWFQAKDDQWVVDTAGEGTQRVAAFWQKMLDDGTTTVQQRWGDGFTKALTDGTLIGHIGAAWEAGFLLDPLDGTPAEGQWRVAQLPDFGAGAMTGPDGGSGVAVMKGCQYLEQAMEFNDWFNTQVDDLATQGLVVAANGTPRTPEKITRQFGGQAVLSELSTATAALSSDFGYAPGFSTLVSMTSVADTVAAGQAPVSSIFENAQTTEVDALKNLGLPVAGD